MSKMSLVITFLLILMFSINSSCLLDKVNTQLTVFGEYDEYLDKLDVEVQLSYTNLNTGKKSPLPGQELKIIVNITNNFDENIIEERTVVTNQMGWARRTFYDLGDMREYDVKVFYEGSGIYKDSLGTIGGGTYDVQDYTTNLPEGISLTVCMPLLLLMGFLGAAMYAAGGNPFGFVDLTTSRGFRMNRNLRKTMFTTGFLWTGIATGMLVGQEILKGIAKARGKEDIGKMGDKEGESEVGNAESGRVNTAVDDNQRRGGNQSQNKPDGGVEANLQKGNAQIKTFTPQTLGKGFFRFAKIFMVVSSLFTGRQFSTDSRGRHSTDIAASVYSDTMENEAKKIFLENLQLEEQLGKLDHALGHTEMDGEKIENIDMEKASIQARIDANNVVIKGLNGLLENTKDEKGKKALMQFIKNLQNMNNSLENRMQGLDEKRENAEKLKTIIEKMEGNYKEILEERFGEIDIKKLNIATIHAMKNALSEMEDLNKDERKKMENALNKMEEGMREVLTAKVVVLENLEMDERYNKIYTKYEEKIKEINDSDISEADKEEVIKELQNQVSELQRGLFTDEQVRATYILNSENPDAAIQEIVELQQNEEKYAEEYNRFRDATRADVIKMERAEHKQREEHLEMMYHFIENPDEYEEFKKTDSESLIFNEDYQRQVLGQSAFGRSPDTIESRIERNREMEDRARRELEGENVTARERRTIEKQIEREIRRNNQNERRLSEFQLNQKKEQIESGMISNEQIIMSLDPTKKGFSDNWETYERAIEAREKAEKMTRDMGIQGSRDEMRKIEREGRNIDSRLNEEMLMRRIENNIQNNIENGIPSRNIEEVARQYQIRGRNEEEYDEDRKIGNKIQGRIDEEINKVMKSMEQKTQRGGRTTREMNKIEKLEEIKTNLQGQQKEQEADQYLTRRKK